MNYTTKLPIKKITPEDGYHYFFGYYDLQPFNNDGTKHLAHRVDFAEHIPVKGETAEVGYLTINDIQFHPVATTNAWNFQQGALLQWFSEEEIIFNDFRLDKFCSVIKNIKNGEERIIDSALACISQDRRWGLSVNFSRIWDFRAGYGYCNKKDPLFYDNAPSDDGVFLVDIKSGESKLIISYSKLKEMFPELPYSQMKLVVNHITFNPSGDRFLFLLRNFPEQGKRWGTILITADRDGGNIKKLTDYQINSHYHWKNDREIMIYSALPEWGIYFFDDITGKRTMLTDKTMNKGDIHCLYSPDKSCFIGDGYPNKDNFRSILFYDFNTEKSVEIAQIYSEPVPFIDIRCDLHNRFSRDGTKISFDSYHDGKRSIMLFDFDKNALLED